MTLLNRRLHSNIHKSQKASESAFSSSSVLSSSGSDGTTKLNPIIKSPTKSEGGSSTINNQSSTRKGPSTNYYYYYFRNRFWGDLGLSNVTAMTGVNLPSSIPSSTLTTTAVSPAGKKFYTPCEVNDEDNDVEMITSTTSKFSCSSSVMNGRNEDERGTMHVPIRERDDGGDDDEEDDFYARGGSHPTRVSTVSTLIIGSIQSIVEDIVVSADILFRSKITILLLFAPLALVGDATSWVAPSLCFVFAAGALIPCAERLSFVTEQVAEHTNGTFGALLNATFGNAPELLISYAALRAGYYRVVQLTLLGSILTNLLFVFGVSCLVGGYKHSVQELRMTSGNVSIGMLFIATSGLLLPAALKMSNQEAFSPTTNSGGITATELHYSRLNSLFMILIYIGYLFFQLHTHKREFEDSPPSPPTSSSIPGTPNSKSSPHRLRNIDIAKNRQAANADEELLLPQSAPYVPQCNESSNATDGFNNNNDNNNSCSLNTDFFCNGDTITTTTVVNQEKAHHHLMTFRAGILWLFIITLCISAMSDIIVDTIHSFAIKVNFSEVFTALVVVPFFSNIAEQTSSILFAYRNEMDLCVGITVGSAVQISLFVLPGSVLIGWMVGRSMSLFFHGFETASLLMGVLTVTAVLQGGTSNWLTGLFCIGVYGMIAVGFWFHQVEDLSVDEEISLRNETVKLLLRS